jgi:zinc/manganese transport system ATP-binding protein
VYNRTVTEPPAAELEHVSLVLGNRTILRDITLQVKAGEFVAVLGPNGAGKSTLLRALLGLIPPASGTIRVGGHTPRRGRGDVGYCPQVRTLDRDIPLRACDLVALGLDGHRWGIRGHSRAERDERVRQALAAVGPTS